MLRVAPPPDDQENKTDIRKTASGKSRGELLTNLFKNIIVRVTAATCERGEWEVLEKGGA